MPLHLFLRSFINKSRVTGYSLKRSKLFNILLILFIVLGALLFRRYDAFVNPQLWSEDGSIFLQQYQDLGIRSLITPYAGYFHLLPRLIAFLFGSVSVNYLYIPACYNASAFVITFLVAVRLWRSAIYSHVKHPLIYSTLFLFVPINGEPFMNLTNIIWVAALYLIDFIFIGYKHGNKYLNYLCVCILSLTGPFSLLLSPIVILIIVLERGKMSINKIVPLAIILGGGIIQFTCIKATGQMYRQYWVDEPPEHFHWVKVITNNISELLFFKGSSSHLFSDTIQVIICCIFFAILLWVILINYRKLPYERKYVLLLTPIIFFASYVIVWWPYASKFTALGGGARYYLIPYTCLGSILILSNKIKINWSVFMYAVFFLLHSPDVKHPLKDMEWKKKILEYYEGKREVIEINPGGIWVFKPHKAP